MQAPGYGKNLVTARATPAPALSINASTSTPLAKAASSAARICAEVKIGEFNQPSRSFWVALASESIDFDDFFFFEDLLFELLLLERLECERSELRPLVWSMYGWYGMLSLVATRVEVKRLATEERPRIPAAISSASFWR